MLAQPSCTAVHTSRDLSQTLCRTLPDLLSFIYLGVPLVCSRRFVLPCQPTLRPQNLGGEMPPPKFRGYGLTGCSWNVSTPFSSSFH